jgi:hypothetical protein
MKSNTIAAFLTMFMVVIYPLVMGIQTDGVRDMARFIPDSALVYFEQRHGSKVLKEFTKSPLGKKFETINFLNTGKKVGLTKPVLRTLEDMLSFYALTKDNKLFHEVFGKRFAVALLSPVDIKQYDDFTDYIKENTIIVAKPEHTVGGLEFLGESYDRYDQTYFVSSAQYGNHHIKRIQINEGTFSMVTIEGSFVMSRNEKQLRRCIDTFDAELPALANNADFIAISQGFEMPDRFFYLPISDVRKFLTKTVTDLTFTGKDLLLKELATTVGFANFGYGSWNTKKRVIDRVLVQYNSNEVNSVVKNHVDAAPIRSSMLSLTTENPMAFYWSNNIKINHFLRYFEKSRKEKPQIENFWSTVENITGKNMIELFSLLGEEVSLVLEPGPKDKFFSFPLGMFFLHVKNVPELRTILAKIIDEYDIPVSVKSHGPIRYSYWTPSPQDGLQPLYGFWGDFIFFGNSSSLLGMIVKKNSEDFSLLDNMTVKAIDPGFTEKNNSVTYLNNAELINVLQKGLDLVGMTLAIEDRETAFKVRTVIDEIINPLLDGARMYNKSCTRSYFTPEMVIIDSITNKTTGPIKKKKD